MQYTGIVASSEGEWCALQSRPNEGARFKTKISRIGIPHFIPSIEIKRTYYTAHGKRERVWHRPMYGSYIFFPTDAVSDALKTTNVARVRYDNWPGRMRRELIAIEEEMSRLQAFDSDMRPGRLVRVNYGPLEGTTGTLKEIRRERAYLFVTLLGAPREMEMDVADLELAS